MLIVFTSNFRIDLCLDKKLQNWYTVYRAIIEPKLAAVKRSDQL